ncbi:MAG TPA: isoprenylcysteine carboxylmethyltransferase family protein [Calditrichia bacterium]|nr:isoprenylcysteine carboxylmethyltransferase family protein [Calditrichota bacterium]HQV33053.1 isoprenylcysteine carboxylmethyltransferase family protein [Calditrichia bacterium]
MKRALIFLYGIFSYSVFFAWFLYLIAFLAEIIVPKTINSGLTGDPFTAAAINLGLMLLFGLQHSLMPRKSFKNWVTRILPESMERSTYVLVSSVLFFAIFYFWQPIPITLWHLENPLAATAMHVLFGLGWLILLLSTFLINHFELFGLQQVFLQLRGKKSRNGRFVTPLFYKLVRHPMMVGILISVYSTPHMTVGHLIFALCTTLYIAVGVRYEERDLADHFGDDYTRYQQEVPKLIPTGKKKTALTTELS